jgi:CRP/FNR family cyclic AMP-dependent transcriptional regulator
LHADQNRAILYEVAMPSILELIHSSDIRRFSAGEVIIEQGRKSNLLWFLVEGAVEVVKDGVRVAAETHPGAVFGELSALLGGNHTATVRALEPCVFHVVENPRAFLESSPLVCLRICELVARRLVHLNQYLVDVKQQFEGSDHFGMLDNVLETLMHRQPGHRIRPSESTIGKPELPD